MSLPVAPCKDCERRELGCHSKCEEYASYKAEMTALNKARREETTSVITEHSRDKAVQNKYIAYRYDK